jgi:hypothetical protein
MSEYNLPFETYCGKVKVEPTDEPLTPFGGLVPFVAFLKKSGIIERLAQSCPVVRTSPNALEVRDIIISYMLTTLFDGKHFSDVNYLRNDAVIPELFKIKRIAGDDTIRRFFKSLDVQRASEWINQASKNMYNVLPEQYILDWDSTVITRYGNQELAEVGYNPAKRGRKSHHPLLAIVADTRLCFHYTLRAGNTVSSSDAVKCMEQAIGLVGKDKQPWLNRGDIGFGTDKIMKWHESSSERPYYLFKLKKTANVKKAIYSIKDEDWQGCSSYGIVKSWFKVVTIFLKFLVIFLFPQMVIRLAGGGVWGRAPYLSRCPMNFIRKSVAQSLMRTAAVIVVNRLDHQPNRLYLILD